MSLARDNQIVRDLVASLSEKSAWEARHAERVAVYAVAVAAELGFSGASLRTMRNAATLHDIGKLSWPNELFVNLIDVSPFESEIRRHPLLGVEILKAYPSLRAASKWIRFHHERLDGSGYPDGLRGDDIPLGARVIAVAEAADVILNGVPWKPAESRLDALDSAGFDPAVVAALNRVRRVIQPVLR